MAKQSGLGARLLVDGFNVSGDITAIGAITGSAEELDPTAIDKEARERILGLRDGGIDATSWWNPGPAADAAHQVYKTLPRTDRVVSYLHRASLGAPVASLVGKQMNYDGERAQNGAFTLSVESLANGYGRDWGVLATPGIRTDTGATNGASIDLGTGTLTFGLQAYLHLLAFTGTSVTVALQGSSDNGVGDAFAAITGGSFGAQTGIGSWRIATSATQAIERYLRVVTTGTFSNAVFAVAVCRNESA